MTQHFNWGYDRRESRQEYLEDRITQMGHEPDQYEQWHAELEALKAQKKKEAWPGAWGEKTTKQQWSARRGGRHWCSRFASVLQE